MAKKKRELTTRRMPGGAQQYARPDSSSSRQSAIAGRMDTIGTAMDAVRRTPRTLENAADRDAKQRMLLQAMIDESYTAEKARETQRQTTDEDRANRRADRREEGGAMKSKKSKAPTTSTRPTPNPRRSDPVSRGNAASRRQQSEQDDVLKNGGRGMKAGGKVKKMAMGGKCRGMGAATRGGNFSRG
jgi:hypothetical protein